MSGVSGEGGDPGGGDPGGLDPKSVAKADARLREALAGAAAEDVLGAVLILAGPADVDSGSRAEPPDPKDFPDRTSWRQAMIDHRTGRLDAELGEIRQALADLGLRLLGGKLSAAVVVEGPAAALRSALALPGVQRASYDHEHRRDRGAETQDDDGEENL